MASKMGTKFGFEPTVLTPMEFILKLEAEVMEGCDGSAGTTLNPDVKRIGLIRRPPCLRTVKLRRAARGAAVPAAVQLEVAEVPAQVPEVRAQVPEVPAQVPAQVPAKVPPEVPTEVPPQVTELGPDVIPDIVHQVAEECMQQRGTVERVFRNDRNETFGGNKLGVRTVLQEHSEVRAQGDRSHPSWTTEAISHSMVLAGPVSLGLRRRRCSKAASMPPKRLVGNSNEAQGRCNLPLPSPQDGNTQLKHAFMPRAPIVPREQGQFKRRPQLMCSLIVSRESKQVNASGCFMAKEEANFPEACITQSYNL